MTDIPDDVVDNAAGILVKAMLESPGLQREDVRKALRVAVEWEREQCAKVADEHDEDSSDPGAWGIRRSGANARSIAAVIRARSNPSATE